MKPVEITRSHDVDIRSVWSKEDRDFTPWLAGHLEWLADDLGLGSLTLEATEVPIPGGRNLDILASDAEGRAVAIENQYGVVDHDHLTRGLAYAVGIQASDRSVSALVVIAEDHRSEFVAVADYLNECAAARGDQGIRVFLVQVAVTQIGESPPAVEFRALAEPNDWEAAARVAQPGRLANAAEFFRLVPPETSDVARAIFADWEARPETWSELASESIVLYARNPRTASGRCHVGSISSGQGGQFWLNPGRLAESRAFDDDNLKQYRHLRHHGDRRLRGRTHRGCVPDRIHRQRSTIRHPRSLRRLQRNRPDRVLLWWQDPAPAQPARQPETEPRHPHGRVTQIRFETPGRGYYDKKLAEGKTKKEALRALKRRISDAVYKRLVDDQQPTAS